MKNLWKQVYTLLLFYVIMLCDTQKFVLHAKCVGGFSVMVYSSHLFVTVLCYSVTLYVCTVYYRRLVGYLDTFSKNFRKVCKMWALVSAKSTEQCPDCTDYRKGEEICRKLVEITAIGVLIKRMLLGYFSSHFFLQ